ncbi:hypothetical protein DERP_011349 [Dermatophagoides pteronyssinus]|uniref:Uncharacterized protein n=1 Tax=Dermatophagoides pteronyssinus TaxID=6956 RepID=A0ABQ8J7G2_DERPT|nr:hypothetical protein DERP_011349 [Dermatophagoides pteronyssinus]
MDIRNFDNHTSISIIFFTIVDFIVFSVLFLPEWIVSNVGGDVQIGLWKTCIINRKRIHKSPAFNPNSYRQAIINYGRTLNRDISQKLVRKIYSFNGQIREYAGGIPSDSALRELAVPLHFSSNIGNMIAPYVVRRFVTKPIEIATDHIANWVDHINSSLKPFSDTISATMGNGRKI